MESTLGLQGLGGILFTLDKMLSLEASWWTYAAFAVVVMGGMELLINILLPHIGAAILTLQNKKNSAPIPVRGKHLDQFVTMDYAFTFFNRLTTPIFTLHALQYLWHSPDILRRAEEASLTSTVLAVVALFVVYDSTYCLFHRGLHHRSIYRHIHKHHHRQMAPSRGSADAINVHPLEYLPGEYNHLLAIWAVSKLMPLHAGAAMVFILVGGILASLNHTRLDIKFPFLAKVYQVKYHDIHHWDPSVNFSQYTMLWDHVFSSFRAYPGEGGKEAAWAKVRESNVKQQ